MRFVIDTNIFVSALSATSPHHWVIDSLLDEKFEICISHDIVLEYEEVLTRKYSVKTASNFLKALQEIPSVHQIEVYFNWNLLDDPDDNKFVDVAVAGGAAFIVSEDRDFRKISQIDFPKVGLMRLADFKLWLEADWKTSN
jgi:putative PIN family toxin of toxin-antitoxin system